MTYQKITDLFAPRIALRILALICALTLITAYIMEHQFGIKPCQLCYYERYVYVAALLITFPGMFLNKNIFLLILGLVFLFGFGLSAYHVGIQQGWFELPTFCQTALFDPNASLEDLRAQLLGTPLITCNVVSWQLFGISLAGYNAIASFVLSIFSFAAYWRNR